MAYAITDFSKVTCEELIGVNVYTFSMRTAIRNALPAGNRPDLLGALTPGSGGSRIPMKSGDHPSRVMAYGFTEVGTTPDIRRSKKVPLKGVLAPGTQIAALDGATWVVGGFQGAKVRGNPGTLVNQG